MAELLEVYANAGPGLSACICFLLGLVFGSFSSVLAHRLPRGESVVSPRSNCPHCRHVLGPADLVPVLSYIWLRGRCRHCLSEISWRYPALELVCGVLGLGGALVGGYGVGLAAVLAWTAGHAAYGVIRRRASGGDQAGMTLVEVLAAGLLLAMGSASVFEFLHASMRAEALTRQRAFMSGLAWKWYADTANRARVSPFLPSSPSVTYQDEGRYKVRVSTGPNTRDGSSGGSAIPIWEVTVDVCLPAGDNPSPGLCDPALMPNHVTLRGVVTRGP